MAIWSTLTGQEVTDRTNAPVSASPLGMVGNGILNIGQQQNGQAGIGNMFGGSPFGPFGILGQGMGMLGLLLGGVTGNKDPWRLATNQGLPQGHPAAGLQSFLYPGASTGYGFTGGFGQQQGPAGNAMVAQGTQSLTQKPLELGREPGQQIKVF